MHRCFVLRLSQQDSLVVKWSVFLAVIGIASFLRIIQIEALLPYTFIDEGHVLHRVMHMLEANSWDPGYYRYPSFSINLIAIVAKSASLVGVDMRS